MSSSKEEGDGLFSIIEHNSYINKELSWGNHGLILPEHLLKSKDEVVPMHK
jgi:hypothetical protein